MLWCFWVIESVELKLFFSGDSGYFDGFVEIGCCYGLFDLIMLEIGVYNEYWLYVYMYLQQIFQVYWDFGGCWLLLIYNGIFDLVMYVWYELFEWIFELVIEYGVWVFMLMMGEWIDL